MENKIKGGKADNLTIKDIAKKFDVSVKDVKSQIKKGKKIESEHTSDEEKQTEIAMDHVSEFPDYYDRIDKMEKAALKYWKEKETNESKVLIKKLLREELENIDEGKLANIAAGVGLAASSLFGGKDAMAQDKFKDKIENLGDKMTQLKTGAGEKLSQFKDDLKQTVSNIKDKGDLKNIGSRNYSFDEIKKEFEEESKKDDVQYGIGESQDHAFSWEKAFHNASTTYMKKKGLNTLKIGQVEIKHHTFQKQDGTYVTIALFRFEERQSENYSNIINKFKEKSKSDNMEYGEGKGRIGASIDANKKYMDKHNIKTQYDKKVFVTDVNQVEVERHDVKKADGTNVTLILYRYEPM
jgi:hypothetical protein